MALLTAAVVLIGLIALLNLVLTLGVVRRLRDHAERLQGGAQHGGNHAHADRPVAQTILAPGEAVSDFTTTDVDGDELTLADLDGPTAVGFFTPDCQPCQELLPRFVTRARALAADGWSVVGVIVVDPADDDSTYRRLLAPVARVVVEPPHGPAQQAFGARAYPAIATLDGRHTIVASGPSIDALPLAAPVG